MTAPITSRTSDRGAKLGYQPALDGMRALAVAAVMLYHGGVGWARGGFLGVDVFFVLSGYLITSLLVQEWTRTGRIALGEFWLRRARRLLPALFVVLLAVAAYAAVLPDQQQRTIRADALATLAYVSNWWFIVSDQSYFEWFVEPSPLRHTWSLAIEEQFYLLFPLLLVGWLAVARFGLASLRRLLLVAAVASAALMALLYVPLTDPSRVYYGTDTRLQALLLGCALALAPGLTRGAGPVYVRILGRSVPSSDLLGWAGLAGILVMVVFARELSPVMYRGGFLVAAALSCVVIAAVTRAPSGPLARALAWRPLVAVGVVSYGLYLWHWPVFTVLTEERTRLSGLALLGLRLAVTGVAAALSYRFVEEPIRTQRMQARFTVTQWRRRVAAATATVVLVTLGSTVSAAPPGFAPPASPGSRPAPVPDEQGRLVQAFLMGDSQSFELRRHYGNRVDGLAVSGSTQLGCGALLAEVHVDGETRPNIPECADWEPRWIKEVATARPDLVVFMPGLGELYDRQVGDEVVTFGTPEYRDWLYAEIDRRRELVRGNAGRFALTTVLCMQLRLGAGRRDAVIANDADRLAWLNRVIREYGSRHPEVPVIDLHGTVCVDGYQEVVEGVDLRDDGLHLNEQGAHLVWDRLGPQMITAAGQ